MLRRRGLNDINISNNSNCSNNLTNPIFTTSPKIQKISAPISSPMITHTTRLASTSIPTNIMLRTYLLKPQRWWCTTSYRSFHRPFRNGDRSRQYCPLAFKFEVLSRAYLSSFHLAFFLSGGWIIEAGRRTCIGAWNGGEGLAGRRECIQVYVHLLFIFVRNIHRS